MKMKSQSKIKPLSQLGLAVSIAFLGQMSKAQTTKFVKFKTEMPASIQNLLKDEKGSLPELQKQIKLDVLKPVQLNRIPTLDEKKFFQSRNQSGGGDTGGGSAWVCRDVKGKITSAEVYDLYEAKIRYHFAPDFENATTTEDALALILARIYARDPALGQQVADQLNLFSADSEPITNTPTSKLQLPPAKDLNAIIVPADGSGCKIVSTVLQKSLEFPEEKKYYVDQEVWTALGPLQRAAMMTHEVLWGRVRPDDGTIGDSTRARYANAKLWALKDISQQDFNRNVGPHVGGLHSFIAKNLVTDAFNVYDGAIATNLGNVKPKKIYKMATVNGNMIFMDESDFRNSQDNIIYEIQPTRLCSASRCYDNVDFVELNAANQIQSLQLKRTPYENDTYALNSLGELMLTVHDRLYSYYYEGSSKLSENPALSYLSSLAKADGNTSIYFEAISTGPFVYASTGNPSICAKISRANGAAQILVQKGPNVPCEYYTSDQNGVHLQGKVKNTFSKSSRCSDENFKDLN
jgi:hypothetical protein